MPISEVSFVSAAACISLVNPVVAVSSGVVTKDEEGAGGANSGVSAGAATGARLQAAPSISAAARESGSLSLGAAKFHLEAARHERGDELLGPRAQARDLAHH